MNQKFIVIAQPRTGSTLVSSLLSSIDQVRCIVEPINPIGHKHHMQPNGIRIVPQQLLNDIQQTIDILLSENQLPPQWDMSKKTATLAAGFKIMTHQILALPSPDQFWQYISKINCKILIISRRNKLMQIISDQIAKETGQPAAWDEPVKSFKVYINVNAISDQLDNIRKADEYILLKTRAFNKKIIYYEDFNGNYSTIENILPWLLSSKHKLTTKLRKQNPDIMRQRVINYDQLQRQAEILNIQHMLD